MERLKTHDVVLEGRTQIGIPLKLRPMTEDDWHILEKWNTDPEILYFSEGDDVTCYTPPQVKEIYRGVCKTAFCFIIETEGQAIGECWLQRMNIEWILEKNPGKDCRRIDLVIGERDMWGKGIGTEVIRMLTDFGFEREKADMIFGCDIWDYNKASRRMTEKVGYELYRREKLEPGRKGEYEITMVLSKEKYFKEKGLTQD